MKKSASKRALVKACAISFILGVALVYSAAVRPLSTEVVQYRTAGYWMGSLSMNPGFGSPVGSAWKGNDFVTVYSSGYKLVVTTSETYVLTPEGFRAQMSFKIFPPPDVRRIKLSYLEKNIGH